MIAFSRKLQWLAPSLALLLVLSFSSCSVGGSSANNKTYALATIFPASGAEATVGLAMQQAVDLAVQQNATLPNGYTLTLTHVDESGGFIDQVAGSLASNTQVMGIVGPFDSQSAVALLPGIEQSGIVSISPSTTLPGLTQADQAATEGLSFTQLHPQGKPVAFFRLPETDKAAGKVAADVALAPQTTHGLAAHLVYIVDDGTASGKAQAAAFKAELQAKQGTFAGQQSLVVGAQDNAQGVVSAIIGANPDIVFYAGGIAAGAELRSTLSLTGAPQVPILTTGPIANDPSWSASVGDVAASAYTTAILPAQDLSKLANTKSFVAAYQSAFSGKNPLPQSALAYDAAMDEISAIKSLLSAGKPVTRAAVLAAVTSAQYPGIAGKISFDQNGDNTTPIGFSLYSCDVKGIWHFQTNLNG